ncbi:rod shape-determining protein RodA [bacterium]|nr:rod shape-determining protein RodA [bacterium]
MRGVPWLLISTALAIVLLSLLVIRSAAYDAGTESFRPYVERQIAWGTVAWVAFAFLAWLRYDWLTKRAEAFYAIGLLALAAVFVIGSTANGARRWFEVSTIRVQPSEFMKYALVLLLARVIAREGEQVRTARGLVVPALVTLVPFALVLKQPDLGTALTYLPVLAVLLFAAGARLRHAGAVALAGAAAAPLAWFLVLRDYQKQRILTFLAPERASLGGAYQALQSQIAVGAGGLTGMGFEQGTQGSLGFLPFRHTDFIFAVVGEEWGFVGGLVLLALYGVLIYALVEIALGTRDLEGRLLVVGVATVLATQVLVNIGMATGIAPVTGITLPLVSYGGSSLLANLAGLGLAASVSRRKVVIWTEDPSPTDPTVRVARAAADARAKAGADHALATRG